MRLLLVRHAETVDNVAGVLAGSMDSALTSHGVLQAQRLASHLSRCVSATHVFSSDLQRAARTAQAICDAQRIARRSLAVVRLRELRERDFGSSEGAKYGSVRTDGRGGDGSGETAEDMQRRVDRFLDFHLLPKLSSDGRSGGGQTTTVVVAHGIILSVLFKAICARTGPASITLASEAQRHVGHGIVLPPWSNTGYLEGELSIAAERPRADARPPRPPLALHIDRVNCVDHLRDLKRTRGGIGSSQFDARQKTVDSFFQAAPKKPNPGEGSGTSL